jgi:hypothetical protein
MAGPTTQVAAASCTHHLHLLIRPLSIASYGRRRRRRMIAVVWGRVAWVLFHYFRSDFYYLQCDAYCHLTLVACVWILLHACGLWSEDY